MRFLVSIIGTGVMGGGIASRLVATHFPREKMMISNRGQDKLMEMSRRLSVTAVSSNAEAVQDSEAIILSVKPQVMREVCEEAKEHIKPPLPVIISLVTAVTTGDISRWMDTSHLPIVRVMTNTPTAIGRGVTALFANPYVSDRQRELVEDIFQRTGRYFWVADEKELMRLTPLIGCAPAYEALLEEAMIHAAVERGIPLELATEVTRDVMAGALALAENTREPPSERRRKVTTPNGVTEVAMATLLAGNYFNLFSQSFEEGERRACEIEEEVREANLDRSVG